MRPFGTPDCFDACSSQVASSFVSRIVTVLLIWRNCNTFGWEVLMSLRSQLAMPVLAIGAAKAFGANVAVVMRNAATNVQELVVPNAGHWLMEEAPAATIAAVQDFLAAH